MTQYRPEFKVMVNMVLNHISAMRPNFIAVDALASDDPAKKAVSMTGIKQAIMQVRKGQPVGFFPAGAVSKINKKLRIEDRQWQPTIIRLIQQLGVPVVPFISTATTACGLTYSAYRLAAAARCGFLPRCGKKFTALSMSQWAT